MHQNLPKCALPTESPGACGTVASMNQFDLTFIDKTDPQKLCLNLLIYICWEERALTSRSLCQYNSGKWVGALRESYRMT